MSIAEPREQLRRAPLDSQVDQAGSVLIEFALVLPLLIMLAVGILYYGYAFLLKSATEQAARDGAERGISVNVLSDHYQQRVQQAVAAEVRHAVSWLPDGIVGIQVAVGATTSGTGCDGMDAQALGVTVTLRPNSAGHRLLPTFSLAGYEVPPGIMQDGGGPVIRSTACARL